MKRYPRSFWLETVQAYQASCESIEEFCAQSAINVPSLKRWLKILTADLHSETKSYHRDSLVEIQAKPQRTVVATTKLRAVTIRHQSGWIIEIPSGDYSALLEVFRALGFCS